MDWLSIPTLGIRCHMIATRLNGAFALVLACATIVSCGGGGSTATSAPPTVGGDPSTPAPSTPTSITINRSVLQFGGIGETAQLSAEVRDQKGAVMGSAAVTWSSSNAQTVTVSNSGLVTVVAVGSATITATSGSATTSLNVSVSQTAATLVVSPATMTLISIGGNQPLAAVARDASGNTIQNVSVSWSASPSSVATVSSNGLVTAVSNGTAVVTATVANISATASVTVQSSTVPQSCSSRPVFSEYLIEPSLLKVITQIGVIGGGNTEIVGRSYAMPVDGMDGIRMPLTAPANMNVVAARHYLPPGAPTSGYVPDWSLLLDAGCGVTVELFHVKDVAPSIKAASDTTIYPYSGWQALPTSVPFRAGETFGWYQRGLNSVAFDVIAHDRNTHNRFSNQLRYDTGGSNLLDIVCPWTLFTPTKRDAYLNVVGAPTGQRVAGTGCGSVERDVAGTPAGQWFTSATIPTSWPLTKSGNYGDPLPIILGVDSMVYVGHTGPSNDIRIARNNPTWKDPATITTSWCYQIMNGSTSSGWLWLRMNSATQMDVSYSDDGLCSNSFPASNFVSYYR